MTTASGILCSRNELSQVVNVDYARATYSKRGPVWVVDDIYTRTIALDGGAEAGMSIIARLQAWVKSGMGFDGRGCGPGESQRNEVEGTDRARQIDCIFLTCWS